MQLAAIYPGGEITLVDSDEFCATDRFGKFPLDYPFLGVDATTGHQRVWYRDEMPISFDIADIRDLKYGAEFDVVVSKCPQGRREIDVCRRRVARRVPLRCGRARGCLEVRELVKN